MDATVTATGPVLVGVDGSTSSASAVAWAAAEASSSPGSVTALVLVHDVAGSGGSWPAGRAVLDRAAAQAARTVPGVPARVELVAGGPSHTLRETAEATAEPLTETDDVAGVPVLVVGRRGAGASRRVRLGTTARRLVHDPGPLTVVVPDRWSVDQVDADAPVVVDVGEVTTTEGAGAEGALTTDGAGAGGAGRALGFALARAAREGRRVVAVAVWAVPALVTQVDRAIREVWEEHADRAERALETFLGPWRAAYPGLEIVGVPTDRHPVSALLDHAEGAEILVVPRGDRACALVEYADCPVAVV